MKVAADTRPSLLKICEVAEDLRLCPRTVQRLIQRGELRALRIGRSIRVAREDLELYQLRLRAK